MRLEQAEAMRRAERQERLSKASERCLFRFAEIRSDILGIRNAGNSYLSVGLRRLILD